MPIIKFVGRRAVKPPAKPPPPKRKPKAKAKPAPPRRRAEVPVPVSPPLKALSAVEASPEPHAHPGPGRADYPNQYAASRYCECEKPMVFDDRDTRTSYERLGPRCLNCGKPVR